jgi:uncharacterized protein YacL
MTDRERIEYLEREKIKELQNKAKLYKRIGMSFFGLIWLGIFLSVFGVNPMESIHDNFGLNALSVVLTIIVGLGFYFFVKSSKIEQSIKHYNKYNQNE